MCRIEKRRSMEGSVDLEWYIPWYIPCNHVLTKDGRGLEGQKLKYFKSCLDGKWHIL